MRIIILLAFLLPVAVAGQTTNDYQQAMKKFRHFYNRQQGDSITAMFGHSTTMWTNDQVAGLVREFGTLQSFRFIGIDNTDPEKVYVFETVFSKKGRKTTSLTLGKDYSLGTFRFITTSEGITALARKSKRSR